MSGFGASGPLGGLPGYDAILQAMTGLMSTNGDPSTGAVRMGTPVVDLATGLYSAVAVLMALHERARSGQGQYLDMTLHDCGMALLHPQAANFFLDGRRPVPLGNPHPNIAPYEKYATRTGEVFVAIGNDGQFRKLCEQLERPELASDPRFLGNSDRVRNRPQLVAALSALFAGSDGHALCDQLLRAGVPAGPVLAVDEATASPQARARGMVADLGVTRALDTPIKLSRTPGGARTAPPRFGAHGEALLAELGYTGAAPARRREQGVGHDARRR